MELIYVLYLSDVWRSLLISSRPLDKLAPINHSPEMTSETSSLTPTDSPSLSQRPLLSTESADQEQQPLEKVVIFEDTNPDATASCSSHQGFVLNTKTVKKNVEFVTFNSMDSYGKPLADEEQKAGESDK